MKMLIGGFLAEGKATCRGNHLSAGRSVVSHFLSRTRIPSFRWQTSELLHYKQIAPGTKPVCVGRALGREGRDRSQHLAKLDPKSFAWLSKRSCSTSPRCMILWCSWRWFKLQASIYRDGQGQCVGRRWWKLSISEKLHWQSLNNLQHSGKQFLILSSAQLVSTTPAEPHSSPRTVFVPSSPQMQPPEAPYKAEPGF